MSWNFMSDRPIYTQLMERIERKIVSGKMNPGDQMMSIRDLSMLAGVNPNTMQKALSELERKGLIRTDRTNGKFINSDAEFIAGIRREHAVNCIKECFKALEELGYEDEEVIKIIKTVMEGI